MQERFNLLRLKQSGEFKKLILYIFVSVMCMWVPTEARRGYQIPETECTVVCTTDPRTGGLWKGRKCSYLLSYLSLPQRQGFELRLVCVQSVCLSTLREALHIHLHTYVLVFCLYLPKWLYV